MAEARPAGGLARPGVSGGRALHGFAVLTAAAALGLIVAGGLVTSTESGLSVPDWPTTYGQNPFTFPISKWVGGIRFEHTHRLIASAVGCMTIILAVWLARREPRRWVRRLGYLALAAVIAQGVLGGMTVLFLLPTAVSVAHACLAQGFFCMTVALAVVTSPAWKDRAPESLRLAFHGNPVARIAAATAGAVFLQLAVGAIMRHTKAGLAIPDFPLALGRVVPPLTSFPVAIHFAHRVTALGVAALVGLCVAGASRTGSRRLERAALGLMALVAVQIALGAFTVLTQKSVAVTTAHVAAGALLLGSTLAIGLSSLAVAHSRDNVVRIHPAVPGRAAAWK